MDQFRLTVFSSPKTRALGPALRYSKWYSQSIQRCLFLTYTSTSSEKREPEHFHHFVFILKGPSRKTEVHVNIGGRPSRDFDNMLTSMGTGCDVTLPPDFCACAVRSPRSSSCLRHLKAVESSTSVRAAVPFHTKLSVFYWNGKTSKSFSDCQYRERRSATTLLYNMKV